MATFVNSSLQPQSSAATMQAQAMQTQAMQPQQIPQQMPMQGQPMSVQSNVNPMPDPQPQRPNFQMALLPPAQDRLYKTWQALHEDVKAFARSQGYAVVIESSLNRDVEGNYRRYNLCCAKGGRGYKRQSKGLRNTKTNKTGCPMRMKAIQEKAWPYNDQWHVIVQCPDHNHEPFTGEPGANVPPQFRKIEADGVRWLMIMHRDAQLTLRQLTIGIRISFDEKYQYVKKSDVRNQLAKIKREEERKAAVQQAQLGLPPNANYTLLPPSHMPEQPISQPVQQMPSLPLDMQVADPDLESDDEDGEEM